MVTATDSLAGACPISIAAAPDVDAGARRPLGDVAAWLAASPVPTRRGDGATVVTGVSLSSQRVRPGDLYAALPGARTHGATFAAEAVASGAVAVLTDAEGADRVGGVRPAGAGRRPTRARCSAASPRDLYGEPAERAAPDRR